MKIKIELDDKLTEDEVVIKCREISGDIQRIQNAIANVTLQDKNMVFWKNGKEYFLPLHSILFFETNGKEIDCHTENDIFNVKHKLYELEEMLPTNFVRVSKSTILNIDKIYSIDKNIISSSLVQFHKTHKQVYISRYYYKAVREKLERSRVI